MIITTVKTIITTLILSTKTRLPYANSLDPVDTPSSCASHPDLNYLTIVRYFSQLYTTLKHTHNRTHRFRMHKSLNV